jgi:predicted phage tail protein
VTSSWINNATKPAATVFTLQRATDANFTQGVVNFLVFMPLTRYTDSAVSQGVYYYRVRAENSVGYSVWTPGVRVAVTAPLPPNPPTITSVNPGNRNAVVNWNPPAGALPTGYYIYRATRANGPFTLVGVAGAGATTFNVTGLARVTRYFFMVRAYNAVGQSANSNVVSATTTQ